MSYQNAVTDHNGNVIGYKCSTCLKVYDTMWSHTCNSCRDKDKKHEEMIKAIKSNSLDLNYLELAINTALGHLEHGHTYNKNDAINRLKHALKMIRN